MDWKLAVFLLLSAHLVSLQLASAAELRLTGNLHYASGPLQNNSVAVTLKNSADYEVKFNLKLQLKKKDGGWVQLANLCSFNGSIQPLGSKGFNCSYSPPAESGEYKIYARADIANSTYTYKDFYFNLADAESKQPEPEEDVSLQFISAPDSVKTGQEFSVVVNVSVSKKIQLEVYSYVYKGKACYSFYGWKGNAVKYDFSAGESRVINLTDSVSHDALNGTYKLKVRARGGKDWDIVREIEVEQVPVDLFKESPIKIAKNGGNGPDLGWAIPLLALVPLAVLLAKKIV